jgi:voltage-gated potassium channel
VTAFVGRHATAWDVSFAVAACAFTAAAFLNDARPSLLLSAVVGAFTIAFLAEFAVRCWAAPSRLRYLRGHWLDLVSCAASCVPLAGGLRIVRLLRLVRLLAVRRAIQAIGDCAHDRSRFAFLGPVLLLLWVTASGAAWILEHGVNPALRSFSDALYWTFITATTVGYGDIPPATPDGRLLAGILAFVGLGLVGYASAQLTALFLHQASGPQAPVTESDVTELRAEIAELRRLLEDERRLRGVAAPPALGLLDSPADDRLAA